jgi:hypothetical protein
MENLKGNNNRTFENVEVNLAAAAAAAHPDDDDDDDEDDDNEEQQYHDEEIGVPNFDSKQQQQQQDDNNDDLGDQKYEIMYRVPLRDDDDDNDDDDDDEPPGTLPDTTDHGRNLLFGSHHRHHISDHSSSADIRNTSSGISMMSEVSWGSDGDDHSEGGDGDSCEEYEQPITEKFHENDGETTSGASSIDDKKKSKKSKNNSIGESDDLLSSLPNLRSKHPRSNFKSDDSSQLMESPLNSPNNNNDSNNRRNVSETNVKQKVSRTIDLSTGRQGARAMFAVIREKEHSHPQCRRRRIQKRVTQFASNASTSFRKEVSEKQDDESDDGIINNNNNNNNVNGTHHNQQRATAYRKLMRRQSGKRFVTLTAHSHIPTDENQYNLVSFDVQEDNRRNKWYGQGLYGEIVAQDEDSCNCICGAFNPNQLMISYLFWAFRSSFVKVLLSAALWFYVWTLTFAILIYLIGMRSPDCINVNGVDFGEDTANFMDAYGLSWTTFSTVGYGLVHPATSATTSNTRECTGITILTAIESFTGILFASFWGAIFLSKVTRVSSFAQVTFSECMVIRYGSGVGSTVEQHTPAPPDNGTDDGNSTDSSGDVEAKQATTIFKCSTIKCPVLEFRVLNRLQKQKRGEISESFFSPPSLLLMLFIYSTSVILTLTKFSAF